MWEKFFKGEIAVYAATAEEAKRFMEAYIATRVEHLSRETREYLPVATDIEFAYNFCDNQLGWASGGGAANHGWYGRHANRRADECYVCNPGAPYKSVTVEEFFGDE